MEDEGLDYLDRLASGGQAGAQAGEEDLQVSGGLGDGDGRDELFLF